MTKQEIEALNKRLEDIDRGYIGDDLYIDISDALTRLAKLEEAVAFKGFDEVPETDSIIDVIDVDKCIIEFGFDGKKFDDFNNSGKMLTSSKMKATGRIGWRYPVGDLG